MTLGGSVRWRVKPGLEGIFFAAFRSVGFQRCLATGAREGGKGKGSYFGA